MAHPLNGADPGTLARIFRTSGGGVRPLAAAGIWASALARWPFSVLERALVRLPELGDLPPPVFVLGHWRSGTTHLCNCMSLGDFAYVPPLAVGMPHDMFGLARLLRPLLEKALPEHRYIDNVPVTPESPQEDEIALASMCDLSFYHGLYFPRRFGHHLRRGLFLEGASEAEIARWEAAFATFLRRIARLQGPAKPLLVKNPVYTGRVAQIRRLLPRARFVHIHRNPFDVFLSMRNFYQRLLAVMALQDVPEIDIDAAILDIYTGMMRRFDTDTARLEPSELVEIGYDQLDADPMAALEAVYSGLDLPGFAIAAPAFRAYLASVESYRRNAFRGDRDAVAKVAAACAPWIARWGYSPPAEALERAS